MQWLIAALIAGLSLSSVSQKPVPFLGQVQASRESFLVNFKSYNLSSSESIGLYGVEHYRFWDAHGYWGEYGYGALSGKRSGYLEGGIVVGYQWPFLNTRLLIGAGGGGGAAQGGGLMINPMVSLGYPITHDMVLGVETGYIHFMNGDISSATIGIGATVTFWNLYVD